jgi:hypothetical protein
MASAPASAAAPASASASAIASASAAPSASAPFVVPDTIIAQHVLIAYKGAKGAPKEVTRSKADAKALADKVRKEAIGGATFGDLAAKYSDDTATKDGLGSLGKFKRESKVKPFADVAFALKVDEISDVVETPFGFHIIKRTQ